MAELDFEVTDEVDITDKVCPLTFVKAKVAIEELEDGEILASHRNDGKLQWLVVLVYHFAVKGKLLRHHLYSCDEAYCEYQ